MLNIKLWIEIFFSLVNSIKKSLTQKNSPPPISSPSKNIATLKRSPSVQSVQQSEEGKQLIEEELMDDTEREVCVSEVYKYTDTSSDKNLGEVFLRKKCP